MIYGKLPIVLLSTVASERKDATNSLIAKYILEHIEEMQNLGIKEIAKKCNVAVSSISRFCKEIGLNDFNELKTLINKTDYSFQKQSNDKDSNKRKHIYCNTIVNSITMVEKSLDMKLIKELCKDILNYSSVAVFGLLKAGSVAINLQGDLLMLKKQVYSNISYLQQLDYLVNASKNDLVIIFSYTGSYFDYPTIRTLKKALNKPKIWFVCGDKKDYPDFIDKVISFDSLLDQASHPYQLQFVASVIAQEYANYLKEEG